MNTAQQREIIKALGYGHGAEEVARVENVSVQEVKNIEAERAAAVAAYSATEAERRSK